MSTPEGPMLRYCLSIFKDAKRFKRSRELQMKNPHWDSQGESVEDWSVNSELFVSSEDSEEEFTNRLKELEHGTKLRRKSTMVSNFGFKRTSEKLVMRRRATIVHKFPIVELPKRTKKEEKLEPISEDTKANGGYSDKVKNFLKVCNKRKLDAKQVAGQALIFLNQLGTKLLVKQQNHMKKKKPGNASTENNMMESASSNFSTSSQEETKKPCDLNVMMSPIKTRKQIQNPDLNCDQKNTLDLWRAYKAGDNLSIDSDSQERNRNSSQTPVMRHIFFAQNSPKKENDDAKS